MNMTSLKSLYNMELNKCRLCHNPASSFCENCGDSYCTTICQVNDWERHRYICMPMPNLIERSYLVQPNVELNIKPKSNGINLISPAPNSVVILEAIYGLDVAFVYSADMHKEREQVIQKVHKYGLSAPLLKSAPSVNSLGIARNMQKLMRLKVLKAEGSSFRVQFIDNGYISNRTLKEMHEISEECINLPCYTLPVHLESVPKGKSFVASRIGLEKFYNQRYRINYVQSKEFTKYRSAELINMESMETLNDQILKLWKNMKETTEVEGHINGDDDTAVSKTSSKNDKISMPINSSFESNAEDSKKITNGIIETPTAKESSECESGEIDNSSTPKKHIEVDENEPTNGIIEKPISKSSSLQSLASKKSIKLSMAMKIKTEHKPVIEPPFKFINIKATESNIKLFVLDTTDLNNGFFGCIQEKDMHHLQDIKNYTDNVFEPGPTPYAPVENEYCMAMFENEWYRARCHTVENDKYFVYYIDFTNEEVLDKECIRPYDMNLTKDCVTMSCAIKDLPDLNEEQIDFVRKWGLDNFQTISVDAGEQGDREGPGFMLVQINDLIHKMRAANLLEK